MHGLGSMDDLVLVLIGPEPWKGLRGREGGVGAGQELPVMLKCIFSGAVGGYFRLGWELAELLPFLRSRGLVGEDGRNERVGGGGWVRVAGIPGTRGRQTHAGWWLLFQPRLLGLEEEAPPCRAAAAAPPRKGWGRRAAL